MRPHLGKMRLTWAICTKSGQKCSRIGGKKFNHNAKSFNDCEEHSRDLMRCACHPKALPRCTFTRASAFTPLHSRRNFTPYLCSRIHAAPMQQHWRRSTEAAAPYSAALTQQYSFTAPTQLHLCCSSHAAAFLQPHSRSRMRRAKSMMQLQNKGVWEWGGVAFYVCTYPRKVCVTAK